MKDFIPDGMKCDFSALAKTFVIARNYYKQTFIAIFYQNVIGYL